MLHLDLQEILDAEKLARKLKREKELATKRSKEEGPKDVQKSAFSKGATCGERNVAHNFDLPSNE